MNKVILTGRLTKDPEIRYSGEMVIAKFSIAVERKVKKGEEKKSDFINITCFGNVASVVEKYFHKGDGINLEGRIQTGSYTNKDGNKVYTTDVIADSIEFPLSNKNVGDSNQSKSSPKNESNSDGFANIPDGIPEELPFN